MNQKELKEILYYDKDTGIFTWKIRKSYKIREGDIAGHQSRKTVGQYISEYLKK